MVTRDDVVPVLRAHGLSGHVAASMWRVARTLLRDTRRRRREYSVLLDAETGNQIGPTLSGSDHEIDVRLQVRATVPGRAYAHLHTHPGNSSFSDQDAVFFLTWSQVMTIAVAALDGRWYVMSRGAEAHVLAPIDVADAFRAEFAELLSDPRVGRSERPHIIWTRIAEQAGLRYDRIGSLGR